MRGMTPILAGVIIVTACGGSGEAADTTTPEMTTAVATVSTSQTDAPGTTTAPTTTTRPFTGIESLVVSRAPEGMELIEGIEESLGGDVAVGPIFDFLTNHQPVSLLAVAVAPAGTTSLPVLDGPFALSAAAEFVTEDGALAVLAELESSLTDLSPTVTDLDVPGDSQYAAEFHGFTVLAWQTGRFAQILVMNSEWSDTARIDLIAQMGAPG